MQKFLVSDEPSFRTALYYHLANLQAFQGKGRFLASLKKADEQPPSVDAYLSAVNWAWLHMNQRPDDYGGFVGQGALRERSGYPDEALKSYNEFKSRHEKIGDKRYDNLANWVKQELRKPEFRHVAPNARTLELHATAAEAERDWQKAEELLSRALDQDPKNVDLWIHRAQTRNAQRKFSESTKDANEALKLEPDSPLANYYRGLSSTNLEIKKAAFRKVLDFNPFHLHVLVRLSELEAESNHPAEALSLLDRAIRAGSPESSLYYRKAVLQNKQGDYGAAFESIQNAIAIDSDKLDYYDERAKAERNLKPTRSETEVVRNQADGYSKTANTKFWRGRPEDALGIYLKSLDMLAALPADQASASVQFDMASTMRKIARTAERKEGSKAKAIEYLKAKFAGRPELEAILKDAIDSLSKSP